MDFSFFKNLFTSAPASKGNHKDSVLSEDGQNDESNSSENDSSINPVKQDEAFGVPCQCKQSHAPRDKKARRYQHGKGGRSAQRTATVEDLPEITPEQEEKILAQLQSFVAFVAKALVDSPDEISTEIVKKEDSSVIMISCAKKDTGKLIGKGGKIIAALRILVSGSAGKDGIKTTVDIFD